LQKLLERVNELLETYIINLEKKKQRDECYKLIVPKHDLSAESKVKFVSLYHAMKTYYVPN